MLGTASLCVPLGFCGSHQGEPDTGRGLVLSWGCAGHGMRVKPEPLLISQTVAKFLMTLIPLPPWDRRFLTSAPLSSLSTQEGLALLAN